MTAIAANKVLDVFKNKIKLIDLFQKKVSDEKTKNRKKGVKYISRCGLYQIIFGLDKNNSTYLYIVHTDKEVPAYREYIVQLTHGKFSKCYGFNYSEEQLKVMNDISDNLTRFKKDKGILLTSDEIYLIAIMFNIPLQRLNITRDLRTFC